MFKHRSSNNGRDSQIWSVLIVLSAILISAAPAFGQLTDFVYADTIRADTVTGRPGTQVEIVLTANNTVPVNTMIIPIEFPSDFSVKFDSISTVNCRTDYFETQQYLLWDPYFGRRVAYWLTASETGSSPDLEPGRGPIARIYFTIPFEAPDGGSADITLDGFLNYFPEFRYSLEPDLPLESYTPVTVSGEIQVNGTCCLLVGDVNHDGYVSALDFQYLRDYLHKDGPPPLCFFEADVNGDGELSSEDVACLAKHIFSGGSTCWFVECP